MKTILFQLTVGPVQGFIAQARKAHDLFAGSNLITYIRNIALKILTEQVGDKNYEIVSPIVDPTETSGKYKQHFNKFQIIIHTINDKEINTLGNNVVDSTKKFYLEETKHLLEKNKVKIPDNFEEQISNFLEINWFAVEIEDNNYRDAYNKLEQVTLAAKFSKTYHQFPEKGLKCQNDNELNIAFYRNQPNKNKNLYLEEKNVTRIDKETAITLGMLDTGEGLSAMSFAKRLHLKEYNEYPSTARIAAWDIFHKVMAYTDTELPEFKAYAGLFRKTTSKYINDQLIFEDNIKTIDFINKEELTDKPLKNEDSDHLKIKDLHKKLLEFVKNSNIPINKYYAIIKFDGDNSGAWTRGDFLTQESDLKVFQQNYSQTLKSFVDECFTNFEEPKGKIVYAGEDFLAFVNLTYLFDLMQFFLSNHFKFFNYNLFDVDKFTNANSYSRIDASQHIMTMSAGVVIAHYKEPLNEVLDSLREVESIAKKTGGKHTIGIRVIAHSGTSRTGVFSAKPDVNDDVVSFKSMDAMEQILKVLNEDEYSDKFINNMLRALDTMGGQMDEHIFNCELKRTIRQSFNSKGEVKPDILHSTILEHLHKNSIQDPGATLNVLKVLEIIHRNIKPAA